MSYLTDLIEAKARLLKTEDALNEAQQEFEFANRQYQNNLALASKVLKTLPAVVGYEDALYVVYRVDEVLTTARVAQSFAHEVKQIEEVASDEINPPSAG